MVKIPQQRQGVGRTNINQSKRKPILAAVTILCLLFIFLCVQQQVDASAATETESGTTINDQKNKDVRGGIGTEVEPHPDPNEEDYPGMIYVGRIDPITNKRLSNEYDNRIKYIFGTAFDETHKDVEIRDLMYTDHHHDQIAHDIPDSTETKTREQVLFERRHNNVSKDGPKPFGYVNVHELDGGITPVSVVAVEPFFLDATLVTNKDFAKFVQSTYYVTDAERYGWSYVLRTFVAKRDQVSISHDHDEYTTNEVEYDPEAEHWMAVKGAYWRQPEGPSSTYKHRENHPVVHVSHHDAAEYCSWMKKRLPGEREYEAAARAHQWYNTTPHDQRMNRSLYTWGDDDNDNNNTNNYTTYTKYANLWEHDNEFPHITKPARDGWHSTSPVTYYPPNVYGFYDMIGNVWEWMRGGKLKERIVRGASYVDTINGRYNHAATLGSRSVIHGTTTTGNVGFRCCKTPKKRIEHTYQWHDEIIHGGTLGIEDQFGKQHMVPERGWEDLYDVNEDEDENTNDDTTVIHPEDGTKRRKRKVVRKYERISTEL